MERKALACGQERAWPEMREADVAGGAEGCSGGDAVQRDRRDGGGRHPLSGGQHRSLDPGLPALRHRRALPRRDLRDAAYRARGLAGPAGRHLPGRSLLRGLPVPLQHGAGADDGRTRRAGALDHAAPHARHRGPARRRAADPAQAPGRHDRDPGCRERALGQPRHGTRRRLAGRPRDGRHRSLRRLLQRALAALHPPLRFAGLHGPGDAGGHLAPGPRGGRHGLPPGDGPATRLGLDRRPLSRCPGRRRRSFPLELCAGAHHADPGRRERRHQSGRGPACWAACSWASPRRPRSSSALWPCWWASSSRRGTPGARPSPPPRRAPRPARARLVPQWPMGAGPPIRTLRRASASGTAASEISIRTQKTSM